MSNNSIPTYHFLLNLVNFCVAIEVILSPIKENGKLKTVLAQKQVLKHLLCMTACAVLVLAGGIISMCTLQRQSQVNPLKRYQV